MTVTIDHTDDNIPIRHLCPLPHRGNAPQIQPPATHCDHHADTIRERLNDIRRYWDVLPELKATARDGNSQTGSKSQAPTQLDIVALTDWNTADHGDVPAASRWLQQFAWWIAERRHLTRPLGPDTAITLLLVHHTALVDYHPADELWHRLRRIWSYLRRCAGEAPQQFKRTCTEPHLDPQIEGPCGGTLWYTGRTSGVLVVCRECGAQLTDTALTLDLMQRNAQAHPFTASRITRQDSA